MSTLKTTNIQNASSATTNIALDTSGNVTVGNNVTVGGGITASAGTVARRNRISVPASSNCLSWCKI